jgi:hypothetical protein
MQDFLGNPLEIGDYVFGGTNPQLMEITSTETDTAFARAKILGRGMDIRISTSNFVRVSKEDMMIYFIKRGYRT